MRIDVDNKLRTMHEALKMFIQAAVALQTSGVKPPENLMQAIQETTTDIRALVVKVRDEPEPPPDADRPPDGFGESPMAVRKPAKVRR